MHYENLEKKLIRQQNLYIRQLEGQLAVYKEKDRTQEQLIENLEHALNILSDEISRLKQEKNKTATDRERAQSRMNDCQCFQTTSLSYRLNDKLSSKKGNRNKKTE